MEEFGKAASIDMEESQETSPILFTSQCQHENQSSDISGRSNSIEGPGKVMVMSSKLTVTLTCEQAAAIVAQNQANGCRIEEDFKVNIRSEESNVNNEAQDSVVLNSAKLPHTVQNSMEFEWDVNIQELQETVVASEHARNSQEPIDAKLRAQNSCALVLMEWHRVTQRQERLSSANGQCHILCHKSEHVSLSSCSFSATTAGKVGGRVNDAVREDVATIGGKFAALLLRVVLLARMLQSVSAPTSYGPSYGSCEGFDCLADAPISPVPGCMMWTCTFAECCEAMV